MSKNQSNRQLRQRIREQNEEIEYLRALGMNMGRTIRAARAQMLQQFADVMCVLYNESLMDVISDEQAGKLMMSVVAGWDFSCD